MPTESWLAADGTSIREWFCPGAKTPIGAEEVLTRFEIAVLRTGAYERVLADRSIPADPSTLVFGNPMEPFRLAQTIGRLTRETVVSLSEATFRELLAERNARAADSRDPRFPADRVPLAGRGALIHAAMLRSRHDGCDPLQLHELALELARWALGAIGPGATRRLSARSRDAVRHTRRTLAERYAEPLTLDGLAAEVGLSAWHLSRVFRAATGGSLHRHLLRIRLHAALERIALGERNLTRIALESGFSSHSHFTRTFRLVFGRTPSRALC